MKRLILLCSFLLVQIIVFAQSTKLDSLQAELASAKDTTKVNLLLEISKTYLSSNNDQAIGYAQKAKSLADQISFPKGAAYALKNIGIAYLLGGNYDKALNYFENSLAVFTKINNKAGIANLLSNIGVIYSNRGDDAQAINYYLKALRVSEEIGDKLRTATVMINIGTVYSNNKITHPKALDFYKKALEINEEIGYKAGIGTTLVNMGEIYMAQGDNESALTYFKNSLKTLEETDNKEKVVYSLNNIAKVYTLKGNVELGLSFHQKALTIAEAIEAKLEIAQSLIGIGKIYNQQERHEAALSTFKRAEKLSRELGANLELKEIYENLGFTYAYLGDYKNAYEHRLALSVVKDTIYNAETNKKVANLQAIYENEKKQGQIDLLTKDKALQQLDLQKQKVVKNASLAGMAFILVLALVLFLQMRNKIKVNQLLTNKNAEINEQKEKIALQRDDLEQTYNNLVNAQEQLIQSEKMASLGQLTAGVAHEINNPINFVSSGIDSLRSNFADIISVMDEYLALKPEEDNQAKLTQIQKLCKELDLEELLEESEQLLRSIKNGANRTKEIVKSLRNFSRLDESVLKETDIHEGLDSTLIILNNLIKDRIKIIKDYGDLPPINCYPGQLNQVFMNILGNAIQAISGNGTITIRTFVKDNAVYIKIKDTGSGMTEDVKKHIFDPFFTTKEVGEGTGLGLSISYGIIQKHKGKIEVESEPGKGTEFTIRLPLILSESTRSLALASA